MQILNFIVWNADPVIGHFLGITFRWYGILFALGLGLGGWALYKMSRDKNLTYEKFEVLLVYMFVGIFLGARLAHCLLYEPEYYLHNPLEILLPITFTPNGIQFTGYQGLASHGGGFGAIVAAILFCYRHKRNLLETADMLAVVTPLTGAFIRLGNLMNSEVVGSPTRLPWAFEFTAVDGIPRHPAQLYEAMFYLLLFAACWMIYKYAKGIKPGFFLGLVMVAVFVFRFFIEFVKEIQVPFESEMTINMGQILSLPYIVAGALILYFSQRNKRQSL